MTRLENQLQEQRAELDESKLAMEIKSAVRSKETELDRKAAEEKEDQREQARQWKYACFGAMISVVTALVPIGWAGIRRYMSRGAEDGA
mmetsp:Transcript_11957/g.31756  ORF Transcript_11957/g.31756 Transcript_11957/m.31756 type:complete len:89 (-) Transcript_11957:33-299(-)